MLHPGLPTTVASTLLGLTLATGCGGSGGGGQVGTTTANDGPRPVELSLTTSDGQWVDVGGLRGQPTLIFVFTTWDPTSQAALSPVSRFARRHPEAHVFGLAAQPDARLLVDAYVHALDPSIAITYDPRDQVALGTSVLGEIRSVPAVIALDAEGHEVRRYHGFPSQRVLERLLYQAGGGEAIAGPSGAGPNSADPNGAEVEAEPTPLPLMGREAAR